LVDNVNPATGAVTEFTVVSTPSETVTPGVAIGQIAYPFSYNAKKM